MSVNTKLMSILLSVILGGLTWLFLIFMNSISDIFPTAQRIFILLGGSWDGYIQFLCYIAFYFALLELNKKNAYIREQYAGFDFNLLPKEDQLILTPEEVADIKLNVLDMEKRGLSYLINDFIKKACTQYRNDQSISETLQVLDVQIENSKGEQESSLSMVRYMINAIMSLGFIGTLIGLSTAIGQSYLAKTDEGMPILTGYLNIAFDTTLVALILGLILNYFYHNYLEGMDSFYAKAKTFIVDNLISRIYNPAKAA